MPTFKATFNESGAAFNMDMSTRGEDMDAKFGSMIVQHVAWGEIRGDIYRQEDLIDLIDDNAAQTLEQWEIEKILYL